MVPVGREQVAQAAAFVVIAVAFLLAAAAEDPSERTWLLIGIIAVVFAAGFATFDAFQDRRALAQASALDVAEIESAGATTVRAVLWLIAGAAIPAAAWVVLFGDLTFVAGLLCGYALATVVRAAATARRERRKGLRLLRARVPLAQRRRGTPHYVMPRPAP